MAEIVLAWHSDPKLKAKYVRRLEAHRKADELTQGVGWESNGTTKGCAVGCLFHAYDHSRGPKEIGVPAEILRLEDAIFEGLPRNDAMLWPTRFLKAIKPGTDLSLVWPRFAVWLLIDSKCGVIRFAGDRQDVRTVIENVATLWQRVIDGESLKSLQGEFVAAGDAAREAAWAAGDSLASREAAWAAGAAGDAAWEAAGAAARAAYWKACADKLIELVAEAK